MCRFHSFVWVEGERFLEEPGVIAHSTILSNAGIDGDSRLVLLPEFDVTTRRLDFDGRTFAEALSTDEQSNLRIDNSNIERFLGQRALRRLEGYLRERFGSPEALAEFAKDYWDTAGDHLMSLVVPSHPIMRERHHSVFRSAPGKNVVQHVEMADIAYACFSVPGTYLASGDEPPLLEPVTVVMLYEGRRVLQSGAYLEKCESVVKELRDERVSVIYKLYLLTPGGKSAAENLLPVDEIRIPLTYHVGEYHSWRDAFLDERYRVGIWNNPFDFDYVLGFKKGQVANT